MADASAAGHEALVLTADEDGVRVLTLNRPERRNAWTHALEAAYFAALDAADRDSEVRVIVVTGAGRAFCPGFDGEDLTRMSAVGSFPMSQRRPQTTPLKVRKPMLAAINGSCAGIGLLHALLCDVRFAASTARFSTAFARRGLSAEYGMSWLLPRIVGLEHSLDLLLSARVLDAAEARDVGLVSRVVDDDGLMDAVRAYARDLAEHCSPTSMAAIRRQVYGDLSRRLDESMVSTLAIMRTFAAGPDFAEGARSFAEHRPAVYPGLAPDAILDADLGY